MRLENTLPGSRIIADYATATADLSLFYCRVRVQCEVRVVNRPAFSTGVDGRGFFPE